MSSSGFRGTWDEHGERLGRVSVLQLDGSSTVAWVDVPADATDAVVVLGRDDAGAGAIQVGVARLTARPAKGVLDNLWKSRGTRAPMGFIVAAVTSDGVWLHYPSTDAPPIGPITIGQAERQLQAVLDEGNGLAAHGRFRAIQEARSSAGTGGFSNHFLFATYHLNRDVPRRPDWESAGQKAAPLLPKRGIELVTALGFDAEPVGSERLLVLRTSGGPRRSVAVLLRDDEQFDQKSATYQLTPVAKALEIAGREDVPWVIALRKGTLRLYPGRDGVGVGQRGQSETYFELDLDLLAPEQAALLMLIFSADALDTEGSAQQILDGSGKYAADLGTRLRDRVYKGVVPRVALAIADQLPSLGFALDAHGLQTAYRLTMRILFRLLFQAYGEATELLPAGRNANYDNNSLQNFIEGALNTPESEFSEESTAVWDDLQQVWKVIFTGDQLWDVPPYGGSLFDPATEEGALLKRLELPGSVVGPALQELLSEETIDGAKGPVDFRSLQVREFGTIYEGLLESSLSLAEQDLTVDRNEAYIPAKDDEEVVVAAGRPFFHSSSGERKATGSYYTPKIVVDHLIERSVRPALEAHLARVKSFMDEGKERQAADTFFDFRVADLAMGSAHFLVAAVDKIERGMRDFLTATEVPGVRAELSRLADKAREALGDDTDTAKSITDGQLLRRQVARRCIYGLDINPLAVELARLALWIHTFVPGLPMSNLDHGLVYANSLTGIGAVDEAIDALVGADAATGQRKQSSIKVDGLFEEIDSTTQESGYQQMIRRALNKYLAEALPLLADVANASEANKAEVARGAELLAKAQKAALPAKRIFDAAVAKRLGKWSVDITREEHIARLTDTAEPAELTEALQPAHMPYLFPEVFLRERPGFDVLVGNPPWEEVKVEERSFWLKYRAGLFGLSDADRVSEINRLRAERPDLLPVLETEKAAIEDLVLALRRGPFPGMDKGDPELAKAFAWRNWDLTRTGGHVGLVGPRTLLNTAGSEEWRKSVLSKAASEITVIVNSGRWAFQMEPRYAVALISLEKVETAGVISFAGPFYSKEEFTQSSDRSLLRFESIAKATNEATVPNISGRKTGEVFEQIRVAPRLDEVRAEWDYRPVREFDVTNDRKFYDAGGKAEGRLPVWGGDGFSIWQPETMEVKAWADPVIAISELQRKRQRQIRDSRSAFLGFSPEWASDQTTLPFQSPRIAFRGISRSTDTRTVISALIPGGVLLQNSAPYFFRRSGSAHTDAWLLGFLGSIPLDWYARTIMETNLNFFILNGFPIPPLELSKPAHQGVVDIAARLAAVDERYLPWATDAGVEVGTANEELTKSELTAELDALVSLQYGLTEEQVEHVFSTFHRGWEYAARLERVLAYYVQWKGDA